VPMTGGVGLTIAAFFGVPKSASKRQRERMLNGEIPCTKRPDWDNIAKIVSDALNGIAWDDDAHIVRGTVSKDWSKSGFLVIEAWGRETEEPEASNGNP